MRLAGKYPVNAPKDLTARQVPVTIALLLPTSLKHTDAVSGPIQPHDDRPSAMSCDTILC